MSKITNRQKNFIEKLGLKPPVTKSAASRVISFVINGNSAAPQDERKRIALLKSRQNQYIGKKARHIMNDKIYIVVSVIPKDEEELLETRLWKKKNNALGKTQPFKAIARREEQARVTDISLGLLELLE